MIVIDKDALMDDLLSLSSDVGKMGFQWLNRDEVLDTVRWQDEYELDEWFDMKDDQPDDDGWYWTTKELSDGNVMTDKALWHGGKWFVYNGDVIAWRYIPEPYRRKSND